MENSSKVGMFVMACVTIMVVTLIGCITYYHLEYDKMVQRAIDKGISPAVMKCVDTSWESIAKHSICEKVLTNHSLTREEAGRLMEDLKQDG